MTKATRITFRRRLLLHSGHCTLESEEAASQPATRNDSEPFSRDLLDRGTTQLSDSAYPLNWHEEGSHDHSLCLF
jgi:hypothetical protein